MRSARFGQAAHSKHSLSWSHIKPFISWIKITRKSGSRFTLFWSTQWLNWNSEQCKLTVKCGWPSVTTQGAGSIEAVCVLERKKFAFLQCFARRLVARQGPKGGQGGSEIFLGWVILKCFKAMLTFSCGLRPMPPLPLRACWHDTTPPPS